MTLNEYIKQSYTRPNVQVLKSLGASDKLIEYLKYTPWNTNFAILNQMMNGGSRPLGKLFIEDTVTIPGSGNKYLDKNKITEEGRDHDIWNWTLDAQKVNVVCNGVIFYDVPNTSVYCGYYGDSNLQEYPFYIISDGDMGGPYVRLYGTIGKTYTIALYWEEQYEPET